MTKTTTKTAQSSTWGDDQGSSSDLEPLSSLVTDPATKRPAVDRKDGADARSRSPDTLGRRAAQHRSAPRSVASGFFTIGNKDEGDDLWLADGTEELEAVSVRTADKCLDNVPVIDLTAES
ncbi:hypothetical protein CDD81_6269 [Ophiocordyceps australis]|uniref:Uncharacterized protein n=1 Tax=Ophiocordyceps australis TaxID=1399860 RepID=A0A2C5XHT0_9HYPO|nr:hypothetical protein CDD81_6269 [Ophiocordyceps australis]